MLNELDGEAYIREVYVQKKFDVEARSEQTRACNDEDPGKWGVFEVDEVNRFDRPCQVVSHDTRITNRSSI